MIGPGTGRSFGPVLSVCPRQVLSHKDKTPLENLFFLRDPIFWGLSFVLEWQCEVLHSVTVLVMCLNI